MDPSTTPPPLASLCAHLCAATKSALSAAITAAAPAASAASAASATPSQTQAFATNLQNELIQNQAHLTAYMYRTYPSTFPNPPPPPPASRLPALLAARKALQAAEKQLHQLGAARQAASAQLMRARSLRESEGKNPEIRALADCVADAEEDYATCYGMLHAGEQHGVRQVVLAEFMTCRQDTRTEDDSMTDMIDVNDDDEHAPINHVLPSARKLMQVCIGEHRDEVKDQGTLQDLRMLRARLLG